MLSIFDLKINYEKLPTLVTRSDIRFSWKLQSSNESNFQKNYRICIFSKTGDCVIDTGIIESEACVEVILPNLILNVESIYNVKVYVTDIYGEEATATGIFYTEKGVWNAQWIKPKRFIESAAPYLRKKFSLSKPVDSALLYISGLGCAELYLNGTKVSEDLLDPPCSNYDKEIFYRVYNITDVLDENNTLVAHLGEGWYAQSHAWHWGGQVVKYGDVCLLAELVVRYTDGTEERFCSDESWRYKYGPVILNNIYRGETYDARYEIEDFADFSSDEEDWGCCILDHSAKGKLIPCNMPAIRLGDVVPCKKVWAVSGKQDGAWILDFGKNFAGIVEFHLPPAPAGVQYVFRFAESLNANGGMDYRSSGPFATLCIQQDVYICKGTGETEIYRPRFTYHGFRYVEVTGFFDASELFKEPDLSFATAYEIHTNLQKIGEFSCDHEYLMKTEEIVNNSFISNYHGIPTDCPVREKCGWLGDAQVICNYGLMKYDLISSYEKYMRDLRTQDEIYGIAQQIAPGRRYGGDATPIWGAAQIIIPYWMYVYTGDLTVIENCWDLMEKWVDYELSKSVDYLLFEGFGDWSPPCEDRKMPVLHSSSMQFFEICDKMAFLSLAIGKPEKSGYYRDLAFKIKNAIINKLYDFNKHTYGHYGSNGIALSLGIYPDGDYELLAKATAALIHEERGEMLTGMYATKYLADELCRAGYSKEIFSILFNENYHSFKTMIDAGATSVWEAIQSSYTLDYDKGVASYNHPMNGSFMSFCYSAIAGLRPIVPGFKEFQIAPTRIEGIGELQMKHNSPYGCIQFNYKVLKNGKVLYNMSIPVNTICKFKAMGGDKERILDSGQYEFIETL